METTEEFFAALDDVVNAGWAAMKRGAYWRHVAEYGVDPDLYRRTMIEIYHYTRHNSINQAIAARRVEPERLGLLRFCYQHANEELGHEKMVVSDLDAIGLLKADDLAAPPLPATDALIGYLYYVAQDVGAIARLGYSYWAETAYAHIGEVLARAAADLKLTERQMTFFVAHAQVDVKHAQEVRQAIERYAGTAQERALVLRVARNTLYLTGAMLDDILAAHLAGAVGERAA